MSATNVGDEIVVIDDNTNRKLKHNKSKSQHYV